MNATARPVVSHTEGIRARLRSYAIGSLFGIVLLVPRLLRLRRNAHAWLAFRVALAVGGAVLVVVPMSIATGWFAAIAGLAMFLAAILLPPANVRDSVADKSKELNALVVLNGGHYQPVNAPAASAQLFVTPDRIYALDTSLQLLLVIPLVEISSAIAAETRGCWIFRIRWLDRTADFQYQGVFAEHLARVAESTIRGVMRSPLPVLQQTRAVGA